MILSITTNKGRTNKMKKLMIMTAMLIGFTFSAQATTKTQACMDIGEMGRAVMDAKNAGVPISMALDIVNAQSRKSGLNRSETNYMAGIVAIAYESNVSSRAFKQAVYENCLVYL